MHIYSLDYPPSTQCEWLLSAPEGTTIHATIFDIDMQPWFLNYFDSLSISRDGAFYAVDNYAGDQNEKTPFTVLSNGTKLGIRFKSNSILNYRSVERYQNTFTYALFIRKHVINLAYSPP